MKRITVILAAAICLILASCTSESSCTYIINHGVGQASEVGDPFSDAALVYEEYTKEIISFDKSHASDWNWTVTVKNDNYAKYDAEAVTKFQKSVDELEAINTKYIEKFSKCTTKDYSFEYTHYLKLSRVSTISAEPAYKEFKISYGK